ncbi:hypothetical protein ACLKA7_015447 [Drosophila subpalustris]
MAPHPGPKTLDVACSWLVGVAHTAERVARKLILQDENVYAGAGRFDVSGHVSYASSGSRADEAEDNDDDKGNNQAY